MAQVNLFGIAHSKTGSELGSAIARLLHAWDARSPDWYSVGISDRQIGTHHWDVGSPNRDSVGISDRKSGTALGYRIAKLVQFWYRGSQNLAQYWYQGMQIWHNVGISDRQIGTALGSGIGPVYLFGVRTSTFWHSLAARGGFRAIAFGKEGGVGFSGRAGIVSRVSLLRSFPSSMYLRRPRCGGRHLLRPPRISSRSGSRDG